MARKVRDPVNAVPVAEGARFHIGTATTFAVRRESKDISLRIRREKRPLRGALSRIPFVRGMHRLVMATLDWLDGISESIELEPQRISKGSRPEQAFANLFQIHPESLVASSSALLIPLLLAGGIMGLPMLVERLVLPNLELTRLWTNAVMCLSRILGAYIGVFLCARLRVVKRLSMYRGAINKVVNAYEARRQEPTLAEAMEASPIYRKSDEAFLMVVLAASMAGFALIRTYTLPIQLLVRLLTVFVAAGVVNEPIQATEKLLPNHPLSVIRAPFLWIERMFVIEPHRQMVEVALCAFNAARENTI